ncbi:hypothetical protein WN944_002626 [Citrus x changshan-huyou]|uniref:Uncharacterized protein n=1 Tax=Citrus x changshan-huyou TaxID=2935761 RepID=A0AAP0MM08_9ROSI
MELRGRPTGHGPRATLISSLIMSVSPLMPFIIIYFAPVRKPHAQEAAGQSARAQVLVGLGEQISSRKSPHGILNSPPKKPEILPHHQPSLQ